MMPEEWFEIAYINFNKAILHGRAMAGEDEFGCRIERSIEQELTPEQRTQVENLSSKHDRQMQALLSSFVDR